MSAPTVYPPPVFSKSDIFRFLLDGCKNRKNPVRSQVNRDPSACRDFPRYISPNLEAIEVHHLVPCGDEVVRELLLRAVASVDLRDGP